jgi:hypothetical protein
MEAYEFVVSAADGLRGASTSGANSENVDGRASETDWNGKTLDDDAEEGGKGGHGRRARL